MNQETALQNKIRYAVNASGKARIFRNLVGKFYTKIGSRVSAGLAIGSADLIGWTIPDGKFLSLEVKTEKGVVEPEQQAWLETVRKYGGRAYIVRSVDEALQCLENEP